MTVDSQSTAAAGAAFAGRFGHAPQVVESAPGRVNLLGEHTDYNGGFVLPTAILQRTFVALALRNDARVRVRSENVAGDRDYLLGTEQRAGDWLDYVQGVTVAAARSRLPLSGFEAYVRSSIPLGAGLSSSAALEVALLCALQAALGWQLPELELAKLARFGENHLVGVPVGIMDPVACLLAEPGSALFLDTRTLAHRRLPLPAGTDLVVVDSGVHHALAGNEYRTRRDQCAAAAEALGITELRDVTDVQRAAIEGLPAPLAARARHVVEENARVLRAVDALEQGDAPLFGALFNASHASLRDDFEVSTPEVDALVACAQAHDHVFGARMTGGGFGGAIVCLVRAGSAAEVLTVLARAGAHPLSPLRGEA
jgi:galactokinase